MATFRYRAIGPGGDVQTGVMDAATEAEVVAHLQRQGSMPMRAEPTDRELWLSALWHAEFATAPACGSKRRPISCGSWRPCSSAGQDLDHAFRYLHETAPNARVRAMAAGLRDIIRDGSPLADALARYPRGFSRMHVALVRAGEASGQLAPTLARLADLLERQKRLATSVSSALIYPCLLIVVAIGAITLLLTEVLPQFVPLFDQSGAQLPASTQFLIASGAFISQNGVFMLLGVAVLVLLLRGRSPCSTVPPGDGPRAFATADRGWAAARDFGRALHPGARHSAGERRIIDRRAGNRARCGRQPCGHGCGRCRRGECARRGWIGRAARRRPGCSRPDDALLRLGEENAELGPIALRAADIHDERTRVVLERMVALLVPAITIIMGAAVAGIVTSLLTAMLSLNDLAAG